MTASRICRLTTFGCKVNAYETQYARELLEANGYRLATDGEHAELCLVNTCTVTHEADAKCRQAIRRLALENPGAAVVVMGCYATRDPNSVRRLPGVVHVIKDKNLLVEELKPFGVTAAPRGISRFDGRRRAFVKVQDGCLLNCSFCIIPSVRPVLRSRPIPEILEEVAQLVQNGHEEIVLTGIHLGHYGIDLCKGQPPHKWQRLWHLVAALDQLPRNFRLRLSSLEASEIRGEFVDAISTSQRLVPHLHLCLQSGSDRILERMKRRHRASSFLERCRRIRAALPAPAFTTDVIVGFPGETARDFDETLRVVEEVGFCKVHAFTFSPRRGTPAFDLPDRVAPEVVAERRTRLMELADRLTARYQRSLIGRTLDVLVEGPMPNKLGWVEGRSCRYVPVGFEGYLPALLAHRVPLRATAVVNGMLIGSPLVEAKNATARRELQLIGC